AQGAAGNGVKLVFTKGDLGSATNAPTIVVSGNQISIVLNTDAAAKTTAQALINALANDPLASGLVSASVTTGSTSQVISGSNVGTLTLSGGAGSRTMLARNDDYFGRDSFLNLHLGPGTYYVAVSSTGNTNFDPSIADSGFGGRTDGGYQLQLS